MTPPIPRATYRLQLNGAFGFAAAADLVPYFGALGVSHCYLSPCLKARPGSTHGYDVTDHEALNPELGTERDYDELCARLAHAGMGQLLDIVPNHVGILSGENPWWLDVLEHGQGSRYAEHFDVDWQPATAKLENKVLVPVLADHYGHVLARGELVLAFDAAAGAFSVGYFGHRLPVDPQTYPAMLRAGLGHLPHQARLELESIVRALETLPHHSDSRAAQREVRAHESLVARKRIATLCANEPDTAARIAANVAALNGAGTANRAALHALLERQAYRLAYWRVAADEINYRRFFDVNDLAGLSTQNEAVLETTHRRLLEWAARGVVHGFRIDHLDGLYDPLAYLNWLRTRLASLGRPDHYLVVEKILASHEHLPRGWPVHGTTGYDFGVALNGLFVHTPADTEFEQVYRSFSRETAGYDASVYQCKQLILSFHLASELTTLANLLHRICELRLETRDFTLNAIRAALRELVAWFPVYRTYTTAGHVGDQDRTHIEWAVSQARAHPGHDEGLIELIRRLLLFALPEDADDRYRNRAARFVAKFQQLTAPVTAKAVEDTLFYRYVRLLSLNEIGGDPRRFGTTPAAFHRLAELRLQHWPHSLLATSTHDSKRSEDVRARLNVLSEMPGEWRKRLLRWRRYNAGRRRRLACDLARNDEYLFYQTLVGSWPAEDLTAAMPEYRERVAAYMIKALREAKQRTSWIRPDSAYEEQVLAFVAETLSDARRNPFLDDLDAFARGLAIPGYLNSLSQVVLKLTSPGVPDIYQGNELWDFSLVDPDNRRPVDFARRQKLLAALATDAADPAGLALVAEDVARTIGDGRIKLFVTWRTLALRAAYPDAFAHGSYAGLAARGTHAEHVCAFARRHRDVTVVTLAARWFTRLGAGTRDWPRTPLDFADTEVCLPAGQYRDAFTGRTFAVTDWAAADDVLRTLPVAVLLAVDSAGAGPPPHPV